MHRRGPPGGREAASARSRRGRRAPPPPPPSGARAPRRLSPRQPEPSPIAVLALILALTVLGDEDEDAGNLTVDREEAVTIELTSIGVSGAGGAITIIRLGDSSISRSAASTPSGPAETYML